MNNQIKIIYDPYKKMIQYQYRNSPNRPWDDLDPNAPLAAGDFSRGTLQNLAEEIVGELCEKYCTDGRGVDLFFSGTAPDWEDLKETVAMCAPDGRVTCCDRLEKLNSPDEILSEIQTIFECLSAQLNSIQDSGIREYIDQYKDTVKPGINLVVTGTYSAGKSSFINALIGEELLPVSSDPTTAKIYKIAPLPKGSWLDTVIRFQYKGTDVELRFNKDGYYVRTKELQQALAGSLLKERLDKVSQLTEPSSAYIYRIIETLNNFEEISTDQQQGGTVAEYIEIDTPFYSSTLPLSEYEFVIFDTPGSDAANHKEHYEILQKALKGQTNGLPILVTNPDNKNAISVDELRKELSSFEALDLSNIMIVINKADEKAPSTLESIGNEDFAAQGDAKRRIFVLSSIAGLGAKKKNMEQCVSKDASFIFQEKKPSFLNGARRLFQYNVYSQHLSGPVDAAGGAANAAEDDCQRLLHNSGLWAVEYGIRDFAARYAISNKCQQAKAYLSDAIEIAQKELDQKTALEKDNRDVLQKSFNDKQKQLIGSLEKTSDAKLAQLLDSCVEVRKNVIADHSLDKNDLVRKLKDVWKGLKREDSESAKCILMKHIDDDSKKHLNAMRYDMSKQIDACVSKGIKGFKNACIKVVTESGAINEEERQFLSQYIMDCPNPDWCTPEFTADDLSVSAIRVIFKKWELKFIKTNECAENVIQKINDVVGKESQAYGQKLQAQLTQWKEAFVSNLTLKLADFNDELKGKRAKLEETREEVERLTAATAEMERKLENIHQLFDFSEEKD